MAQPIGALHRPAHTARTTASKTSRSSCRRCCRQPTCLQTTAGALGWQACWAWRSSSHRLATAERDVFASRCGEHLRPRRARHPNAQALVRRHAGCHGRWRQLRRLVLVDALCAGRYSAPLAEPSCSASGGGFTARTRF